MRISSVTAGNVLSFAQFTLSDLDPSLSVIVGPNGSGKTNLVRLLQLARDVLSLDRRPADLGWALTLGSQEPTFTVGIGLEFNNEWDRQLLTNFVGAALTCRLAEVQSKGKAITQEAVEMYVRWVEEQLTPDRLGSLFKGDLEIKYRGAPESRWEVAFAFDHARHRYRWLLAGSPDSVIVQAHATRAVSTTQPCYEVLIEPYADDLKRLQSKAFDIQMILPNQEEKGVVFRVDPMLHDPISKLLRRFGELPSVDLSTSGRYYPAAFVFNLLFERNLLLMHDSRLPPKELFTLDELKQAPDAINLGDGANLPLYLFRIKNGDEGNRAAYGKIQQVFREFTGLSLDLRADLRGKPDQEAETLSGALQPVVVREKGDIPIQRNGAGVWEALILSAFIAAPDGRILVLDEPALNLHPTLQRRVLHKLKSVPAQSIVITHSPYLIPVAREEDLQRIIRFYLHNGSTKVARLCKTVLTDLPNAHMQKWIKEMGRAVDVPSLLFAQGVILVEGETESGALDVWFSLNRESDTMEEHNLALHFVGGDQNFGTYVNFLTAFKIPWVIICDGKVVGDRRIFRQIGVDVPNAEQMSFEELRGVGRKHGVFTLAQDCSQEFEHLPFITPHLTKAKQDVGPSKVRQGRHIAHSIPCPDAVASLYQEVLAYIGCAPSSAPR